MQNLYSLARFVRSSEEAALNENLLSAVLAWTSERFEGLLYALADISHPVQENGSIDDARKLANRLDIEENLDIHVDSSAGIAVGVGRFDLLIEGDSCMLGIENKVVEIGAPNCLDHKQILKYCRALEESPKDKDWLFLCMTPDKKDEALGELRFLPDKFMNRVLWLSWKEVWMKSKELYESAEDLSKAYIVRELKVGIEMAQLKPFEGFSHRTIGIMEDIRKLDEIQEFLSDIEARVTSRSDMGLRPREGLRRCGEGHPYVYDLWQNYVHQTPEFGELTEGISYGPSFELLKKELDLFLEIQKETGLKFIRWGKSNPDDLEELLNECRLYGKDAGLRFVYYEEDTYTGFSFRLSIDDPRLSDPSIVDLVVDCIDFLRSKVIVRVFSR